MLQRLIDANILVLDEIKDRTPGDELRQWLNRHHGPGTMHFEAIVALARQGLDEGWVAADEVTGPDYRRQPIASPTAETFFFSLSAVYIDSSAGDGVPGREEGTDTIFAGHYHGHPYGEINLVIPIDERAELAGPDDWQGLGWVCAAPGTRHYPEVRNGALLTLYYLPAGRIHYKFDPSEIPPWEGGRVPQAVRATTALAIMMS